MIGIFAAAVAGAAEPVVPSAEDAAGVDRVGSVRISPDGTSLVYALTHRQFDADDAVHWKVQTQLWGVRGLGTAPGAPRRLTTAEADATDPQWAPDGSAVAFLRDVDDHAALHVLPMDGGEAERVDTGELVVSAFAWAPDGRSFAVAAPVPETEDQKKAREATGSVERFGREYRPDVLWTVPSDGGEPVRIGAGGAQVVSLAWSPDGERLAVVAADTADPQDAMLGLRPFVVERDGTWRALDDVKGAVESLRWSPDGKRLAWLSAGDTLTLLDVLQVRDLDGKASVDVARALDATLTDLVWTSNDALVALATEKTRAVLLKVAADGSKVERLPGIPDRPVLGGLDVDRSGTRLAAVASSPSVPGEPAWIDLASGATGTVPTSDTGPWALGPVEVVHWKGPGGVTVEGVLTMPPADSHGPVPLLVMPHGGPDGVTVESFSPWVRYFAGRGYAVLQPNYRGGIGYGRAFYSANRGKLGDIEFGDIEAGVDSLIRAGRVDPDRLVYGGWSWGGYLTAWTIGHTNRYKAAIAGAAVVDVVSQYCLSDVNYGIAADWEYLGNPWEQPGRFAKSNPLNSLHRARTPTLIAHGANDQRVNLSSSVMLWRALTDEGVETELLVFPGEPHGFEDPVHVTHLLESWGDWMDAHVTPTVAATP